jgi:Uma2 family endonuclease
MPTLAASPYAEAVTHLAPNMTLLAADVSWEEYEQLLEELGEHRAARVFYDQGKLEIMSPPTKEHEVPRPVIYRLIVALSEELDLEISSVGTTTLRRLRDSGAEPDDAYYIRDIGPALGPRNLDMERDPPPHIILEVDQTSSSLDKFPIYARLGAPEIWRVSEGVVRFHHLQGDAYAQKPRSRAFPSLASETLTRFLQQGLREGETKAAKAFRQWLRENPPAAA